MKMQRHARGGEPGYISTITDIVADPDKPGQGTIHMVNRQTLRVTEDELEVLHKGAVLKHGHYEYQLCLEI